MSSSSTLPTLEKDAEMNVVRLQYDENVALWNAEAGGGTGRDARAAR